MPRIIDIEANINQFFCFKTAFELLEFQRSKKERLDKA
jgi:hypothetical protein